MGRSFNRKHDYEAKKIEVEADSISKTRKIRRSSVHHAGQADADGNVRIKIKQQYNNEGNKALRPDSGTELAGDAFTFDAREIVHQKSRGRRKVCTAKDYVRIFRRKGE